MKRYLITALAVSLALAGFYGCSSEQLNAPEGGTAAYWSVTKSAGPSEIVLALDVSEAVSDESLTALVDGLGAALADPDIVPADGSIAVSAIVYGDTIATPFAGLVPVTTENLENTIMPALGALVTDRLVTGAGADLAAALDAAGEALAMSSISDLHVLVLGAGAASDTSAASASCEALTAAGIMVSAISLGEGAFLGECVANSGGWFGGDVTDATWAAREAVAYMLHVNLLLDGSATELARGEAFTATATIHRGLDPAAYPVVGQDLVLAVVSGPNAGEPVEAVTDTAGRATLSYEGLNGPGTDTVVAQSFHPGTGLALTDTVTVAWLNTPPVCDAGGPYAVTVTTDTVQVMLDGSASSDADGDSVTFLWSVDCDGASFDDAASATPVLTLTGACLCVDALTVSLTVGDGYVTSDCEATVTIDDQRPPVVEMREEPIVLWPPNHKYETYTPEMFIERAEDACGRPIDLSTVAIVEVRSDEPDDDKGDGRTVNDIVIHCPNTVELRAERMGGGDGRVYTIVYRVTADNGVSVDEEAVVVVPHDSSSAHAGVDPDGGFTVVPDCGDSN